MNVTLHKVRCGIAEYIQKRPKLRYWTSVRWPVANLLNRLDSQCWCNLVDWALRKDTGDWWADNKLPSGGGVRCRAESATHRDGCCYCGKFVNGERFRDPEGRR